MTVVLRLVKSTQETRMPTSNRVAEHPIHEQFTQRWSPRAFTDATLDKPTLLSFFEAARWAPSAYNAQPWRFLFALRGTPEFERYLSLLVEFNQGWAKHAAALVVIVSKTTFAAPGSTEEKPAPTHAFDTGAAWGQLALQAHLSGWHTHGMSGLDFERARTELKIPEGYAVQAMVAIGKIGDKASLVDYLQAKEVPSQREPLCTLVAEGDFSL